MTSIGNIEIYPIISFLIFFTLFIMACIMAFRISKKQIEELSNIPLDE